MRASLILCSFALAACATPHHPAVVPGAGPSPGTTGAAATRVDSASLRRAATVATLKQQLGEKGTLPAGEVFHNIQVPIFKNFPATRLLAVMDQGYGRSLGVSCEYCHVPDRWDSDSLSHKSIARQMQLMVLAIDGGLLQKTGVRAGAIVNCTTCHAGSTRPITDLGQRPAPPQ